MGRQDEIVQERLKKIKALREQGIDPYISKVNPTHTTDILQDKYKKLAKGKSTKDNVTVAGRLMNKRDLGKIIFGVLNDGLGKIQIVLQDESTPAATSKFFSSYIDSGDIIQVQGHVARTDRGELSVIANKVTLATKSILPLPEKWHGIQDNEEKLRKRYLDILMNSEVSSMFVRKAKFWNTIRTMLIEKGFLEVETPILENSAGGASATPFSTHHNALDLDVYLRISMGELWQKKLMVAGYPKTFEIGRQFRNEGMDAEHLQDYTQMEFYWGYANYKDGMELVEEMYKKVAKDVFNKTEFTIGEHTFDLGKKWKTIDFVETIKKETGIDIYNATDQDMEDTLRTLRVDFDRNADRLTLIDTLWKHCRKKIAGPVFLIGHPVEVSPLAKRDVKDPKKVERFQVILGGSEVGNGYSELNDPIDQEQRFIEQQSLKDAGNAEAQSHDTEFVEALKYGMPPTCGFGVSERLFSFLEGKPIRETVIFPLMKPEKHDVPAPKELKKTHTQTNTVSQADTDSIEITRDEALTLLKEHVKSESLVNHCLAVEASVRAYALKYGANIETWGLAGLLHDFDYEKFPNEHPKPGVDILRNKKYPSIVIQAILSHANERTGVNRESLLDKVLFAVDELSGLIVALSKVRPNGFEGMTSESVEKALKKKEFAKNVSRADIDLGIKELGIDRKEHFELVIKAVSSVIKVKK